MPEGVVAAENCSRFKLSAENGRAAPGRAEKDLAETD